MTGDDRMGWASRLRAAWDAYWFKPAPLRQLALTRIIFFALFLLWHLWHRGGGLTSYSGTDVYAPMLITRVLHGVLRLPYLVPSVQHLLFQLMIFIGVVALVGFRTTLSTILTAVLYTYLKAEQYSHGGYVHHPDAIVALSLWALALSPCGAVLSIDAARRRAASGKEAASVASGTADGSSPFAGWPFRFVPLFTAMAYFLAGACKLWLGGGTGWLNGDTLRYYLAQAHMDLGMRLAEHHFLTQLMSISTVMFELGFWLVLVFPSIAWVFALYGLAFHIGSIHLMNVHFFPFPLAYVFLFDWERMEAKLKTWIRRT
jgi:hypothetical protein